MQSRNARQTKSAQLFKTIFLYTNTSIELISLLTNRFVYYTLLEVSPRAHQPLPPLCHLLCWRLVDSFLYHSPNALISRTKERTMTGTMNKQLECVEYTITCIDLLKRYFGWLAATPADSKHRRCLYQVSQNQAAQCSLV